MRKNALSNKSQTMKKISTPISLLLNPLEDESDLCQTHIAHLEANEELLEVKKITENTALASPSPTSINIIMAYAKKVQTIHREA